MLHVTTLLYSFVILRFVASTDPWPFSGYGTTERCHTRPSRVAGNLSLLSTYRLLSDHMFHKLLRDSCGTYPYAPLRLAPITFHHDCFKVFSHYFFTGGDACPYDHRCYKPRRLELTSGLFVSDTVCDGNIPEDKSLVKYEYCGLVGAPWSQGFYRFSAGGVYYFPAGCFVRECGVTIVDTKVGIPEDAAYTPAYPIVVAADIRATSGVFYTERTLRSAHFVSKDANRVCFAHKERRGCELRWYNVSSLRHRLLLDSSQPPAEYFDVGWSFSESFFFLHDFLEGRRAAFCVHVTSSSRSLFAQLTQGVISIIIYALRPIFEVLMDIFSSILRTLIVSLLTDYALFNLAQFSLLHAALYYFTANLYFHALLAILFAVRTIIN